MDDEAFKDFVTTNAQRFETETLVEIVTHLQGIIGLRRSGKPPELVVGCNIEAIHINYDFHYYGEVKRLLGASCIIREPGSNYDNRIAYSKYAMRILDDKEWYWIEKRLLERRDEIDQKIDEEHAERKADIEDAIRDRETAARSPRKVLRKDGSVVLLYRGAYVHAFREDHGHHFYGVVVQLNPKSCYIAPPTGDYDERVIFDKYAVVETLTDQQWKAVLMGWSDEDNAYGVEIPF